MSRRAQKTMLACALLLAAGSTACGYRSDNRPRLLDSGVVQYEGGGSGLSKVQSLDSGLLMPDGRGGYLWNQGAQRGPVPADTEDAMELRLRVKELAAQLLETRSNEVLAGLVALPVSFVNLNDFNDTSPLGRYFAEAMFYEFNQRGVPVREYRMDGKIAMRPNMGEFALTRNLPPLNANQNWSAVLVGTYLKSDDTYFINARLVRPTDGLVLRTAQLVFTGNSLLAALTAKPLAAPFSSGTLKITRR